MKKLKLFLKWLRSDHYCVTCRHFSKNETCEAPAAYKSKMNMVTGKAFREREWNKSAVFTRDNNCFGFYWRNKDE